MEIERERIKRALMRKGKTSIYITFEILTIASQSDGSQAESRGSLDRSNKMEQTSSAAD
jgi:hypothetical protein